MGMGKKVDKKFEIDFVNYQPRNLAPLAPSGLLKGTERSWNAGTVANITKMVVGLQGELEKQLKGEDSQFYNRYLGVRNSVMSLFGYEVMNPDQILELQLAGAKDLNEAMGQLLTYAKEGLVVVSNYNDRLETNVPNTLRSGYEQRNQNTELIELREGLIIENNKLSLSHPDYIPNKLRIRFLNKKIRETGDAYQASMRSVNHYERTTQHVDQLASILGDSVSFSQGVMQETDSFIEYIVYTRHIPEMIRDMSNVNHALETTVDKLSNHVQQIYNRMQRGTGRIISAATNLRSGEHFNRLGYDIKDYMNEMSQTAEGLKF